MKPEIIVAILSGIGTLIGTIGGIMTSNRLTGYRIGELEKQVSKHNNLVDRMYRVESRVTLLEDEMKGIDKKC